MKNGIQTWIHTWKKNGWKTADRKPVKNAELWRELDALAARHDVRWHWVKGHNGHPGNERADALANRGVEVITRASAPRDPGNRRGGRPATGRSHRGVRVSSLEALHVSSRRANTRISFSACLSPRLPATSMPVRYAASASSLRPAATSALP